jgi:flagellar basal body rod protein FlgB
MAKIAAVDNQAMNALYRTELTRNGNKVAAEDKDIQAFQDHADYNATLDAVMKEDKRESWDPNDMLLD